ncbi:MAG TPA: MATE family efflux transporter, partial [Candidatus Nanoarchaeia archaeon]|nr:MATE family efflux transporter [Candidatus Nanoarchaeia archaeon]
MAKSKLEQFIKQPRRSLIYLSIPAIASAMVETFYNLTDTFFIGRLGAEALAAMTFSFPLFFMLVSLSLGINAGMGSRISRYIGEGNKRQAENTAIHGLALSLVISLLIALIAIPLLPFLFKVLGAQGIVLSYAISYTAIILAGSLFMFLSYALSSFFAAQGDTKTAMKIDVYSLIANMILTPIFMFVFDMGIAGAALATVLSVIYAFVLALYYLRDSYLTLSLKKFKYSSSIIKEIFEVGFPSTLMMLTISFYVVFLNRAMAHFSVEHVAAFGVVSRLETVVTLPVFGLSIGAMTLAGMFFGAKKYKLLKDVSKFSLWLGVGTSII